MEVLSLRNPVLEVGALVGLKVAQAFTIQSQILKKGLKKLNTLMIQ